MACYHHSCLLKEMLIAANCNDIWKIHSNFALFYFVSALSDTWTTRLGDRFMGIVNDALKQYKLGLRGYIFGLVFQIVWLKC